MKCKIDKLIRKLIFKFIVYIFLLCSEDIDNDIEEIIQVRNFHKSVDLEKKTWGKRSIIEMLAHRNHETIKRQNNWEANLDFARKC